MRDIKNDLEKINTNIETPADESNPTQNRLEEGKWGSFLNNKTFTQFKNNFILLKNNLSKLIVKLEDKFSEINTNYNSVNNTLESHTRKIEDIERNGIGIKEQDLVDYVNKKKENTLEENLNVKKNIDLKTLSLEHNNIIELQGDTINIGNSGKSINIIGKDTKLLYNGTEIQGGSGGGSTGGSVGLRLENRPVVKYIKNNQFGTSYIDYKYSDTTDTYLSIDFSKNSNNKVLSKNDMLSGIQRDNIYGDINVVDNNLTSNNITIVSENLDDMIKDYFLGLNNTENVLDDKELAGFSFEYKLLLNEKRPNGRYYEVFVTDFVEVENILENRYNPVIDLDLRPVSVGSSEITKKNIADKYNNINFLKNNSNIDNFKCTSELGVVTSQYARNTLRRGSYSKIDINSLPDSFKNNYNSNYEYRFVIYFRKIKRLYLTNSNGAGGSGGSSVVNISSQLGLPIYARVPFSFYTSFNESISRERFNNRKIFNNDYSNFFNKIDFFEFDETLQEQNQKGLAEFRSYNVRNGKDYILALKGNDLFKSLNEVTSIKNIPANKVKRLYVSIKCTVYGMKKFTTNEDKNDISKNNADLIFSSGKRIIDIEFNTDMTNLLEMNKFYKRGIPLWSDNYLYDKRDNVNNYFINYFPYRDVRIDTTYFEKHNVKGNKNTTQFLVFTNMDKLFDTYQGVRIFVEYGECELEVMI